MESYFPPTSGLETTMNESSRDNGAIGEYGMLVLQPPKCSVYPQLPADYYCVDCHCFVSSHGHVRGAHRNHRFLTIREAAELHVPAMKAWTERCETQLQKAEGILVDLGNASRALDAALEEQADRIESVYASIIESLTRHKEALKRQLRARVATEQSEATQAWHRMDDLMSYYSAYLEHCAALLVNVPPVEAMDTATVLWSADVMRTAELLGSVAQVDEVWLPELTIPRVGSHCTPDSVSALLHMSFAPCVDTLPTAFDVRPFRLFPAMNDEGGTVPPVASQRQRQPPSQEQQGQPGRERSPAATDRSRGLVDSRRQNESSPDEHAAEVEGADTSADQHLGSPAPRQISRQAPDDFSFRLEEPQDPADRETVALFNDRTSLTRRQRSVPQVGDESAVQAAPEHLLLRGDCKLSSPGLYGWAVHIDRLGGGDEREENGEGTSHVLAGIAAEEDNATGAGVVWDGLRIIGPREDQVHTIANAAWRPRAGTTLHFVLEIEDTETGGVGHQWQQPRARRSSPPAMLHCYFGEAYVTTVFLPAPCAWNPAVSVLSAEDQVTVRPLPAARALGLAMLSSPAASPAPKAQRGSLQTQRSGEGWQMSTPHRPPRPGGDGAGSGAGEGSSRDDRYSPELREILDYAERLRRNDKKVAWM